MIRAGLLISTAILLALSSAPALAQPAEGEEWLPTVTWDGVQTELPGMATRYVDSGRLDRAEPYYRRLVEAREEEFGPDNVGTLIAANSLGALYVRMQQPARAKAVFEKWLPRAQAALGEEDMVTLTMLTNSATALQMSGQLAAAAEQSEAAADVLERTLGPDNQRTMTARANVGALYYEMGRAEEALAILQPMLGNVRSVLGPSDPLTLLVSSNLASIYIKLGQFERSEDLLRQVMERRDVAIIGDNPPAYYNTLAIVAVLKFYTGRFDDALTDLAEAERGLSDVLRSDHPTLLSIRNSRASIFIDQGRLFEAEPILVANVAARENALGPEHPETLTARSNLASLYGRQDRLSDAESMFEQVRYARAEVLGPNHPDTLSVTNKLANILNKAGRSAEAMRLLEQVVEQSIITSGEDFPGTITARSTLASLLGRNGEVGRAVEMLESAISKREALSGQNDIMTMELRLNLTGGYRKQLRYSEAEAILADLLPRYSEIYGVNHPISIVVAAALAETRLELVSKRQLALEPARLATAAMDRRRIVGGSVSAEGQLAREAIELADIYRILADALWVQSTPDEIPGEAQGEALRALQFAMEGTASRSIAQMATRRYAQGAGDQIGALAARRQQLADSYTSGNDRLGAAIARGDAAGNELAGELRERMAEMLTELESVDGELRRDFPEYFTLIQPTPLDDNALKALFAADEAGLMIVPGRLGTHIVVIRQDRIVWRRADVDQSQIEDAVSRLLWDVGANVGESDEEGERWSGEGEGAYPFDRGTAHELYNALIAPVISELGGVRHLTVASSGALSSLPLTLLVSAEPEGPDGSPESLRATRWFADDFAISQVPSFLSLQSLRASERSGAESSGGLIGFGDPVLDGEGETRGARTAKGGLRRSANSSGNLLGGIDLRGQPNALLENIRALTRLPGTAAELEAIRIALSVDPGSIYLGDAATEANFRNAGIDRAGTLVIATHGLIAGELDGSDEPALVFTPPATFSDPGNDGLLTASEVAGLRLTADWVLLSACNTAAGDARNDGSALSGLARSFFYAGAQSLLASYWPVRDDVGARFSVRVLELEASDSSMSRAEALQQTMREIREDTRADGENDTWAHPSAWAPFGLIGDGTR